MNEQISVAELAGIHARLVGLMGERKQSVGISLTLQNFGDHNVLDIGFVISVFYPEYEVSGPEGQRECAVFMGDKLEVVVNEAVEFIRKEYGS